MTDHTQSKSARLTQPLSEAELAELDDFLESDAAPDTCMSLEKMDGFMCALAVGPKLVLPSRWLATLWGGDEGPSFESEEQANRIMELLMRHWNSIQSRVGRPLAKDADFYIPEMVYPDDDLPDDTLDTEFGKAWVQGFMTGVSLEPDAWREAFDDEECANGFGLIMLLELGHNPDQPEIVIDLGKRRQLLWVVPQVVHAFHQFWKKRKLRPAPATPVKRVALGASPKVGRNEPCPCGSGRKFKKCCGAPNALH